MLRKLALPVVAALAAACVDPSAADFDAVAREGLVLSLTASPAAIVPGDEVREQVLKWTGQSYDYDRRTFLPVYSPLPPGTYRAYAVLNGDHAGEQVSLRSNAETVTVR